MSEKLIFDIASGQQQIIKNRSLGCPSAECQPRRVLRWWGRGEEPKGRRISVFLSNRMISVLDDLRREFGLRARGAVLQRLLEDVASNSGDGHDSEIEVSRETDITNEPSSLVLISRSEKSAGVDATEHTEP